MVQLAGQTTPYSSTPMHHSSVPNSENDDLDTSQSIYSANKPNKVFLITLIFYYLSLAVNRPLLFLCFSLYQNRMTTQTAALAAALFWKLLSLQKIPPLSLPREVPSSSGIVTVIPAASRTTQSAKVKRIWLEATTILLLVLHHLMLKPNLQEDPP